jgi:DNA-binding MarR family transcriptional regulator
MADEYVTKGQAMSEIMQATGYGRQAIEKKMVELEAKGLISYEDDPGDTRKKLISRTHVQVVISSLTRR